jgi:hypothetical protein
MIHHLSDKFTIHKSILCVQRRTWTTEEARAQEWPAELPSHTDRFWKLAGFRPAWYRGSWRMRINVGGGQTKTIAKNTDFRTAYQTAKARARSVTKDLIVKS